MTLSEVARSAFDAVVSAFSSDRQHDDDVAAVDALKKRHAAQAAPVHARREATQRAYDEWMRPARELEAAQRAVESLSWTHHGELALAERAAAKSVTRALEEFAGEIDVLLERVRATPRPAEETTVNVLNGRPIVVNADLVNAHVDAVHGKIGPYGRRQTTALTRARIALAQELPKLSSAEQKARIAELRAQIEEQFSGIRLATAQEARERL
jgi:hypothetical protein